MRFDTQAVWTNVRQAKTEDLLDRVTVFRGQMEPEALDIIETELQSRGVRRDEIEAHQQRSRDALAVKCSFCRRPAIIQAWGWHLWWGKVPLFPRFFSYCEEHRPKTSSDR
jgi:hypothetical protein